MKTYRVLRGAAALSALLLIAASLPMLARAADQLLTGTMVLAPSDKLGEAASGAAEDTLRACLAGIPVEATAGQRMLAEQSCQGNDETRRGTQHAPTF